MARKMKLSTRITLGFAVILAIMAATITFSLVTMYNTNKRVEKIVNVNDYTQAQNLREIVRQLSEVINGEAAAELDKEVRHETKYLFHAAYQQPVLTQNNRNQEMLPGEQSEGRRQSLPAKGQKTKVISPEEVIPLEKDNKF